MVRSIACGRAGLRIPTWPARTDSARVSAMNITRRTFMNQAAGLSTGAGLATLVGETMAAESTSSAANAKTVFKIYPIGRVEKTGDTVRLRIFERYADALLGLEQWSHVNVLYWFDKNDNPRKRAILRVHPRGNRRNPLVGVFACRAPVRPNLIALTVCKILSVKGAVVTVEQIDAFDGTPIIDLKPFIPPDAPQSGVRVPSWTRHRK